MTPLMRLEQLVQKWSGEARNMQHLRGNDPVRFQIERMVVELDAALSAMKEDRSIGATAVDATKASEFPMTPPLTTERKKKRPRSQLHWASGQSPNPALKWAIYDWDLICPVAYMQSRVTGRKVCALLNTEAQR
jgi:hypothetical protein